MPKINDASQLKLTGLIHQLALNPSSPDADKELRSTGKSGQGLYVKEGHAVLTSTKSRAQHRAGAINQVLDSLVQEYGCEPQDAEQIMRNVFGEVPAQMTAGNARKLYETGTLARKIMELGAQPPGAFDSARTLGNEHAGQVSQLTEKLKARGLADQEAFEAACVVRANILSSTRDEEAAITGVLTGQKVVAGNTAPSEAAGALSEPIARSAFLDTLKNTMAGLPPYDKSSDAEKVTWLHIANAFGTKDLVPLDRVKELSTDYKASLLQALSEQVVERRNHPDKPGIVAAYRSVIQFNRAIKVDDVMAPNELAKMNKFLASCRDDPILQNAKDNWLTPGYSGRETAVNRVIELHAKEFGYTVPPDYLKIESLDPLVSGNLSNDGTRLTINPEHKQYDDFLLVLGTLAHESTHRLQIDLRDNLIRGAINPKSPRYNQARLIKANDTAILPMSEIVKNCGFSELAAWDAYRDTPMEKHAFFIGGYATSTYTHPR